MCAKSRTLFARVVSVHTGTRTGTTLTILFMYKKILLVSVWLIVSLLVVSLLCEMLSASDTISNMLGFVLLIAYALLSVKTRLFTKFKFNNKNNNKIKFK